MKKLFTTLLFIALATTTFSQVTFKPGVRAGVNLANITNSNFDTKTDFYVGGFLEMKFARFYALQPELMYTRQGAKNPNSGGTDLEVQYLGLNLANKFTPFSELGIQFIVGPNFNFKLDDNNGNQSLEDFDFGIFSGLGYEFPMGLSVEARYNFNFVDIFGSNVNNTTPVDEVLLNNVIQIGVSYKFDFSK